jgi:hypothetical protein
MQRSMRIGRRGEFCLEVLEWLHAYLWKIPCVRVIWCRWIFGGVSFWRASRPRRCNYLDTRG